MQHLKICLIGNPNSGKSSLFNILTGLNQKVSNFPGVTVEKKTGNFTLQSKKFTAIDLPGTYSLFPNSKDEKIVSRILTNPNDLAYPDAIIYICDLNNLERHLLLASQLIDLNIPLVIALNMVDIYEGTETAEAVAERLQSTLGVKVIPISTRKIDNIDILKESLIDIAKLLPKKSFLKLTPRDEGIANSISLLTQKENKYYNKLIAHHHEWLDHITRADKAEIKEIISKTSFVNLKSQIEETFSRFNIITPLVNKKTLPLSIKGDKLTYKLDSILTNKWLGPIIFLGVMLVMFQSIFAWSELPMTVIENLFTWAGSSIRSVMPAMWYTDLLVDGLLAGLGGVLVFIPQITILFLIITLLEESGYMSRAVYLFDPLMQKFGLNGRSMVALISSGACAIPAIMSTRTISNWKERLTTIMVSPLISCSARIPVYTVLVAFVVPAGSWGPLNYRGLVFMGLYLLGIIGAMASAYVFKVLLKNDEPSFLMLELPVYKAPLWKNVFFTVKEKVLSFIIGAGQVIVLISILLWFLASYGPSAAMEKARLETSAISVEQNLNEQQTSQLLASKKIEASYAGHLGKFIEPTIKPLGFDWKIGIALLTSFAAREVFVGAMATIYSIGDESNEDSVRSKMNKEYRPGTTIKVFNPATSLSLLIFYVFAMQCMSTIAVTKKETNSWKWPAIQFLYMGVLAYVGSFITYQLMSSII